MGNAYEIKQIIPIVIIKQFKLFYNLSRNIAGLMSLLLLFSQKDFL